MRPVITPRRLAWALLLFWALLSAQRVRVLRSNLTVWTEGAAVAPCLVRPHLELAKAAADAQQPGIVIREWAAIGNVAAGRCTP